MKQQRMAALALVTIALGAGSVANGQSHGNPVAVIAAQREAVAKLSFLDGTWRGTASMLLPNGEKRTVTHTERVGPFLDGSLRVIDGRSYDAEGRPAFGAFAILSFDASKNSYNMRSYAQGNAGDFALTTTADGFSWEVPAGGATIRYTAVVKDGEWREVGERVVPGQEPVRVFEMKLSRLGNTDWPAAGAVAPQ